MTSIGNLLLGLCECFLFYALSHLMTLTSIVQILVVSVVKGLVKQIYEESCSSFTDPLS